MPEDPDVGNPHRVALARLPLEGRCRQNAPSPSRPTEPGAATKLAGPEEWVLLAQWDVDLDGREGSTLHWVIPRQDLVERRFDRVHVVLLEPVIWNR
ncbi:hypothetical protein ACFV2N_16840 [Streptomyces sp. NPDC059680]|uniref:hypothetical protein n=1 Tax=Streptomyces sp. NPDC059680 TaxID=3346904 RepID=UPI0036B7C62F